MLKTAYDKFTINGEIFLRANYLAMKVGNMLRDLA